MGDLENIVDQRKKDAKNKELLKKARTILDEFGIKGEYENGPYSSSGSSRYQSHCFTIDMKWTSSLDPHCYSEEIQIESGGKLVLEGSPDFDCENLSEISAYAPGEWEEELEKMYVRANKSIAAKEKKEKEESERQRGQEEQEYRKRWGVDKFSYYKPEVSSKKND